MPSSGVQSRGLLSMTTTPQGKGGNSEVGIYSCNLLEQLCLPKQRNRYTAKKQNDLVLKIKTILRNLTTESPYKSSRIMKLGGIYRGIPALTD